MSEDWNREEAEATVTAYFDMLDRELRGEIYSKAGYRQRLVKILTNRSAGAINRKFQHISSILTELGFPYIAGYKPLANYQHLLHAVVSERLDHNYMLTGMVREPEPEYTAAPPPGVRPVSDILTAQVDPPTLHPRKPPPDLGAERERSTSLYRADYLAEEARNISLGRAGELFVIDFERARLTGAGAAALAARIEHVAVTEGPQAGFDILSYETSGQERYIEVKTTCYGKYTPFFVTRSEVEMSRKIRDRYFLYRAFDFHRQPKLFIRQGPLEGSFRLDPYQYVARV
jgi:hypothetical protein